MTDDRGRTLADVGRHLATLPDRFNDVCLPLGWIATERTPVPVMEQAIAAAAAGDMARVDEIMSAWMTGDEARDRLRWISVWPLFKPRAAILELAADDYDAGRYHASIPVVLAQAEGWAADMDVPKLFSRRRDRPDGPPILVDGSISAQPSAAPRLMHLLSESGDGSRPLELPLRNVILHGRSTDYGTRLLAAKAWMAILALHAYAQWWVKEFNDRAWTPRGVTTSPVTTEDA